ncbi:unnamed protein product [Ilex paraguariensis]|uniref:ARM repeat superfamily protein n=1 Tax=Ilex paraguariensis TaxID=185542 RepID=A0ABC8RGB3_9AQUA
MLELLSRLETRSCSQTIWRGPSERFVPRIVSSPTIETRADLSGVETQVRKLVEDLKSSSLDEQRNATGELCLLVNLLQSPDTKIQKNAITTLLKLSINDNNKATIANVDAIEPLIHVLETGSPEAKENSFTTLFSLSVIEDNQVRIGRAGAIQPTIDLLGNGTPRGQKDAAMTLINFSIFHENKARIVQAGAVKALVRREGFLYWLRFRVGFARGKENAVAALLQLCNRFCNMVLQEGVVPLLVALSQSGTPIAKEKARALLAISETKGMVMLGGVDFDEMTFGRAIL